MPALKLTCPRCAKPVKAAASPPPGKRLRCPGCGTRFPVPEEEPKDDADSDEGSGEETGTPASRKHPAGKRRRPRKQKEPERRRTALWVGLGAATLAVAVVAIVLAMRSRGKKDGKEQAAAPPPPALPASFAPPVPTPPVAEPTPVPPTPPAPVPTKPAAPPPVPAAKPAAPPPAKDRIDAAIDLGVRYLRGIQHDNGTWGDDKHLVGLAALPGLTLVECGVNPYDPQVQKASQYLRDRMGDLTNTYEIALAILFLDRMGHPSDRKLIQTLAVRLIAGQKASGGWTYTCPIVQPKDEHNLLVVLKDLRPEDTRDLFVEGPDGQPPARPGLTGAPDGQPPSRPGLTGAPTGSTSSSPSSRGSPSPGPTGTQPASQPEKPVSGSTLPGPSSPPPSRAPTQDKARGGKQPPKKAGGQLSAVGRRALAALPKNLKQIPAMQPRQKARKLPITEDVHTDNSNTQFAILALWAAGRHDVPMERALALLVDRFRVSQEARNGGWDYHYRKGGTGVTTPSMTGAGLLGVAVGLSFTTKRGPDGNRKKSTDHPLVRKGFEELGRHIGHPWKGPRARRRQNAINLYFMWTVERVAVIYGVKHIDKKDWYGWGSEELLDHQFDDGHWESGGYPGATKVTDTCLALLFLKRANLAKDLSRKLEHALDAKGSDAKGSKGSSER